MDLMSGDFADTHFPCQLRDGGEKDLHCQNSSGISWNGFCSADSRIFRMEALRLIRFLKKDVRPLFGR